MSLSKRNFKKGFTLIELLVTISIFVILTGVVIFNESKFNSTVLLTNLAYDTALTIRQAQTFGINVKEFGDNNFIPYGVHFEKDSKSFILFADLNSDGLYDGGTDVCSPSYLNSSDGCVNRYNIQRGNYISDLCVDSSVSCGKTSLDIVFKRPNPDALIYAEGGGSPHTNTTVFLKSSDGSGVKKIYVQSNGLIQINP